MDRNFKVSILTVILAIAAMCYTGCKKDPDNPPASGDMQTIALKGKVMDVNGSPLGGVQVITGSLSAATGSDGTFSFSQGQVIDSRTVIKFEKSGYFTLTRSGVKENEMFIEAVLYPKGNSDISVQTTFDAAEGATLEAAGMKVDLPAASIMRADGSAYTGAVQADMLYLSPNNENFTGMMPGGDLAAIRSDNSNAMLVSWGMTNVNLTDNTGNPLQINTGSRSELTWPIPEGMEDNPPASIPLWSFDENKGIWIEEGVATLQGDVYVGDVAHFSWHNLDVPAERVTIKGQVVDCENKPVAYVKVTADQTSAYTSSEGKYTVFVPEYTPVTLTVTANGGSDSQAVPGQPGGTTYTAQDLKVPCGGDEPPGGDDPGTYTSVEKGAIKYEYGSGGNGTYIAYTFDNNGWRIRWDFFEDGGQTSIEAWIINHFAKTYLWGDQGGWSNYPYNYSSPAGATLSLDEEAMKPYQQPDNVTIAGKSCKLFKIISGNDSVVYATWNGLILMMEVNDEVVLIAVSATLDVPESAFDLTFDVTWLPPVD